MASCALFSIATRSLVGCASLWLCFWRSPWPWSGVGREGRQLLLGHRLIAQAEFHRHIIEPARPEAAVEMPHSRNDYPDHRHLDIRPRLVEHHEIISRAAGDLDAGVDLLSGVAARDRHAEFGGRDR